LVAVLYHSVALHSVKKALFVVGLSDWLVPCRLLLLVLLLVAAPRGG
jgi:hypothetical protein